MDSRVASADALGAPDSNAFNQHDSGRRNSLMGGHSLRSKGLPSTNLMPKKLHSVGQSPSLQSADVKVKLEHCSGVDSIRKDSDSMESMQEHLALPQLVVSDPDSLALSDSEQSADDDDEHQAELITGRSARLAPGRCRLVLKVPKEKKKVGRPIAYRGDPDSPALTEQERRRIKRRIANRESARRVRHKRQGLLDDLQVKIDVLQSQNATLRTHAAESKQEKEELSQQLRDLTLKHKHLISTNANMHVELESLRSSLQLRMTALENALDKQEHGSEEDRTVFGTVQAQSCAAPGYSVQSTFPFAAQGEFKGSPSFQMAIDNFPSFQLGEPSVDLLPAESQDLMLLKSEH